MGEIRLGKLICLLRFLRKESFIVQVDISFCFCIRYSMATFHPEAFSKCVEMNEMFRKETDWFRRTKHFTCVTEEEFVCRLTALEAEFIRIRCWHDLKRQDISKSTELMRDEELLKEIKREMKTMDKWEKEIEVFKRKRLCVDGLSKLIWCSKNREEVKMAEGGRDVFCEEKRDNHLNMYRERLRDVNCKINEFEGTSRLLHDASPTLLFSNFQTIVDELVAIIEWLGVSAQQEFFEDERILPLLREEREEIRGLFGENHSSEEETVSTVRIIDYTHKLPNC